MQRLSNYWHIPRLTVMDSVPCRDWAAIGISQGLQWWTVFHAETEQLLAYPKAYSLTCDWVLLCFPKRHHTPDGHSDWSQLGSAYQTSDLSGLQDHGSQALSEGDLSGWCLVPPTGPQRWRDRKELWYSNVWINLKKKREKFTPSVIAYLGFH